MPIYGNLSIYLSHYQVAKKLYRGNLYSAADRILNDFRKGQFGHLALEVPPEIEMPPPPVVADSSAKAGQEEGFREEERPVVRRVEEVEEGEGESLLPQPSSRRIGKVGVGEFEGW